MTAKANARRAALTRDQLLKQQADIRRNFAELARLYPGCFDANGKPIVATLRPPTPM